MVHCSQKGQTFSFFGNNFSHTTAYINESISLITQTYWIRSSVFAADTSFCWVFVWWIILPGCLLLVWGYHLGTQFTKYILLRNGYLQSGWLSLAPPSVLSTPLGLGTMSYVGHKVMGQLLTILAVTRSRPLPKPTMAGPPPARMALENGRASYIRHGAGC